MSMTTLGLGLVLAVGVFLMVTSVGGKKKAATPEEIAAEYLAELQSPTVTPSASKGSLLKNLGGLATPFVRGKRKDDMQLRLSRAGMALTAQEFFVVRTAVGLAIGGFCFLRFGNPLIGIPGFIGGFLLPGIYVKRKVKKRRGKLDGQLGDSITVLANGIKAGYSIQQAINEVAESAAQPMSDELGRITRETALGVDLDLALQRANIRIESKDFDLMVTAILIHRSVGGNLAEVLDKIADTIRERVKLQGEVSTLTAQARASGYIVTGLPFGVAGLLSVISPGFELPLFTNPIGWALIAVGMVSITIGYFAIRKITDIKM